MKYYLITFIYLGTKYTKIIKAKNKMKAIKKLNCYYSRTDEIIDIDCVILNIIDLGSEE